MINSTIVNIINTIELNNPLHDIDNYSNTLTISKVVLFFERKGIIFTKTMIQNYVKIELLPPPLEKRYYTKQHLMMLVIINLLKSVYSLDEIKEVFKPYTEYFKDNDSLKFFNLYEQCLYIYSNVIKNIQNKDYFCNIFTNISNTSTDLDITVISLMLQSAAIKQVSQAILYSKYNN